MRWWPELVPQITCFCPPEVAVKVAWSQCSPLDVEIKIEELLVPALFCHKVTARTSKALFVSCPMLVLYGIRAPHNRTCLCMEALYLYAIKNQLGASKDLLGCVPKPPIGALDAQADSLWHRNSMVLSTNESQALLELDQ